MADTVETTPGKRLPPLYFFEMGFVGDFLGIGGGVRKKLHDV